ncbi:MAG: protease HtpX [Halobacteriovoraceae bacterium]|nr:protease HtpX [Halobacteriovoraceae bacterium]|tara:strand:+ start:23475 stop:24365 length:891 start_codon:yes stop_codon:yes gene_type:complete
MFRRIGFFILMNAAVLLTVSIVLNVLGVGSYVTQYGLDYQSLMIFCLVWGMAGSFISLALSKWMAKRMMGVQIVDGDPRYAGLVNTVHRLAKAANLPKMPEVGIFDSPEVNAFATGPSKSNSLVAVSTGLLHNMRDDEVEGVLGHEVAHIANGDMVTMTLIQGVVNAFVMFLARVAAFAVQNALSKDEDSPVGGFAYYGTVIVFDILFGFLGMFVTAWFSRMREYRADQGGAKLAGRSNMVNALKRLQSQYAQGVFDKRTEEMNAFKISSKGGGIMSLISTHPRLEDRIIRLETGR